MLESREVTKKYGGKTAVERVSLKLEPGKIYALLGPNGSGKTTWMKMAAGLVKPTSGDFAYKGQPLGTQSRREIAYMSTEPYFYSWMTAADVGKYYQDFFGDFSPERYRKLLERMELEERQKTKAMSSGMMAKLKIAVTMARKARVYLLDEPLNGVDLIARDAVMECVLETAEPDVALLISSHLVEELERVADTAVFMRQGQLAGVWDIETLRGEENQSVANLYRKIYGHGGEELC